MRSSYSLLFVLALVFSTLMGGCAPSAPTHPDSLNYPPLVFQLPDVERIELPNGIRLYLKEDNELPLVQISAMIGTGAINTPPDKSGFSTLFGATWRAGGTRSRAPDVLEEELDMLAANLSASMGVYSASMGLSLRTEDLERGVEILAEMMQEPAFAEEHLELERLKAQEAVRRQNDKPGNIAKRRLMKALYPEHYLGRTATQETLAAVTREDLLEFHKEFFAPNNLWLAVSGDFDRDRLVDLLNRHLGDWPPRPLTRQKFPEPPRPDKGLLQVVDKDVPQTTVLIGDVGLTKDHPDQYVVRLLNYILGGGGFNSRMMREIRSNRGLAYSAYSYFQVGRRLPGPFVAGTETKNVSTLEALSLIRELMDDLREKPVSAAELQLAKESTINSFVFNFDNTHAVVSQKMRLDFFDYPENYLADFRDRVAAVTVEDIQRVAREFIHLDRQQVVLVGKAEEFVGPLEAYGLSVQKVSGDELDQ